MKITDLQILIQEGEGTTLEFKENFSSSLARELGRSCCSGDWLNPSSYRTGTRQVLSALKSASGPLSRNSLQKATDLHDREHFVKEHFKPLWVAGLIEMTIPDKPTSSKQKYRLTTKGKNLLARLLQKDGKK